MNNNFVALQLMQNSGYINLNPQMYEQVSKMLSKV